MDPALLLPGAGQGFLELYTEPNNSLDCDVIGGKIVDIQRKPIEVFICRPE